MSSLDEILERYGNHTTVNEDLEFVVTEGNRKQINKAKSSIQSLVRESMPENPYMDTGREDPYEANQYQGYNQALKDIENNLKDRGLL